MWWWYCEKCNSVYGFEGQWKPQETTLGAFEKYDPYLEEHSTKDVKAARYSLARSLESRGIV